MSVEIKILEDLMNLTITSPESKPGKVLVIIPSRHVNN